MTELGENQLNSDSVNAFIGEEMTSGKEGRTKGKTGRAIKVHEALQEGPKRQSGKRTVQLNSIETT